MKNFSYCCVLFFWACATLSGCSWQTFNKDNPDEYHKYWENEENRKNSILYPYTEEYEQERKGLKKP